MLLDPFDPIAIGERITLAFDFTDELAAAVLASTSWTCQLLVGIGTDPNPQDRIETPQITTTLPVLEPDGSIVYEHGQFSVATMVGMPITAAGGTYLLEATGHVNPTPASPGGQDFILSATILCYDPAAGPVPINYLIDSDAFRADFTEFSNVEAYPDRIINYWLLIARGYRVGGPRWGGGPAMVGQAATLMDNAIELFVAHNLVLDYQARQRARRGGAPGVQVGAFAGGGANGASISYDTSATSMAPYAGHWGLTTYGLRYLELVCMVGAGMVVV